MSALDTIARGIAAQARAAAATALTLPRLRTDGSIVALGDSITANTVSYAPTAGATDSWLTRGIFTMLLARSGGRLRAAPVAGWPLVAGGTLGAVVQVLVARGGSGYSPATTLTAATGGGTPPTLAPIIVGGVIVGVTILTPGAYNIQSPFITVSDPGGGSGAVLTAIIAGTGQYAVGALDSQQMEAFVPPILAGSVRNVLFLGGTNNQSHGIPLADGKASILSICQRLTAGGVRVIAVAPLDRADKNGSDSRRHAAELRRWYGENLAALVPGVVVVDPSPFCTDPNLEGASDGSTGFPAAYTSDGLHPSALGADAIARVIWGQIAPLFPGPGALATIGSGADQYDAAAQPTGNLLAQPIVRTQATVAPGSGEAPWTGTRLPNLFLSRVAGGTGTGTIAASTELRSDGRFGTRQVLSVAVTGAAQGETYRLSWTSNGTAATFSVQGANTLQVGDVVRAGIDELQMSGVSGLRGVKLRLVAINGVTLTPAAAAIAGPILSTAAWGDFEDASFPAWSGDTLFLQTRQLTLTGNCYGVALHLDFVCNAGAAAFTAKLFGASVRKTG